VIPPDGWVPVQATGWKVGVEKPIASTTVPGVQMPQADDPCGARHRFRQHRWTAGQPDGGTTGSMAGSDPQRSAQPPAELAHTGPLSARFASAQFVVV